MLGPVFVVIAVAGCATNVQPQPVGAQPAAHTDEAGLWQIMDRAEERMKTSPLLERSPEINAFARDLVCRIAGPYCADIRVYVLNLPYFNAMMAPNGAMQIWSGLLVRAENEAQVAFVIAHEVGHYVERHTVERWRTAKNALMAAQIFSIGAAVAGVPAAGSLGTLVALSTVYGYSREQEREADRYGFDWMTRAGYDGRECARIWRYLVGEVEHSDFDEKRKRRARASIFNTHPLTRERIDTLEELARGRTGGEKGFDRYRDVAGQHLRLWLDANVHLRDYGESLFLIDHLMGFDRKLGTLHFYEGEVYRLRHQEGDGALAQQAYERAIEYPDAPPGVWRELGQRYRANGEDAKALAAFEAYLQASPQAEDRLLVERYVRGLQGGGTL